MVQSTTGPFLAGDRPSLADVCLLPQLYNARRFQCDLSDWSSLLLAEEACLRQGAFFETRPENQRDAVAA